MKRGTSRNKKMFQLASILNIPRAHAAGILELLWEFTEDACPQGDIGSVSDAEIAEAIGWKKKPAALIGALCESNWLDKSDKHRLLIHDWPDHCEFEVCRKLVRLGKDFCAEYGKSVHDRRANSVQLRASSVPIRGDGAHMRASHEALAKAEASESTEGVQGKPSGRRLVYPPKFEDFWSVVWLKTGKDAAFAAWKKKAITVELQDLVVTAAKEQGQLILEHAALHKHSVLHPSTWLNEGRYLDETQALLPLSKSVGLPVVQVPDKVLTPESWREKAAWFAEHGRPDDAARCESHAAEAERERATA